MIRRYIIWRNNHTYDERLRPIPGISRLNGLLRQRAEGSRLRRLTGRLVLAAVAMAAVCLATGCGSAGSAVKSKISSLAPHHSSTASPRSSGTITRTPAVTPTVTPSTQITTKLVTPQPKSSATPASGSSTNYLWLWVLLGVVVLVGVIVWIARSAHRRRAAAAADWRSRAVDAYAAGSALDDAMSAAERPGGLDGPDAAARWSDIQRCADELARLLYGLRETARNEDDRTRATDVIGSLQAVRSAMDAEQVPGGADPQQAGIARSRLHAFEASLRALQSPDRTR